MSADRLSDAEIEAIADRVAELVRQPPPRLMTVEEVAEMLRVRPEWVYANADALGAFRLGSGERGRLRFDRERIKDRLGAPGAKARRSTAPRPRRRAVKGDLMRVGPKRS